MTDAYTFRSGGRETTSVRFAARDAAEARREGRVAGRFAEPFPHLEPGSWHRLIEVIEWRHSDRAWTRLVEASRGAVRGGGLGWFGVTTRRFDRRPWKRWTGDVESRLRARGELPDGR